MTEQHKTACKFSENAFDLATNGYGINTTKRVKSRDKFIFSFRLECFIIRTMDIYNAPNPPRNKTELGTYNSKSFINDLTQHTDARARTHMYKVST